MHVDWPTRLVVGLLAWPVMIFLAIVLSYAAEPGSNYPVVVVLVTGVAEVAAAAVAIVFPVWAFVTWAQRGDDSWDTHCP